MTKPVKITLWSIGGLFAVIVIALAVVVNIVFSKDKLTPIVRDQVPNYITCESEIGEVELTFFSTFPNFAFKAHNVSLINPKEGAQSDTLLRVNELIAEINVSSYLKHSKVDINTIRVCDGIANLYIAADSTTNFDIVVPSSEPAQEEESPSTVTLDEIALHDILVDNVSVSLVDETSPMHLSMNGLHAQISGESQLQKPSGKVDLQITTRDFAYVDTLSEVYLAGIDVPRCQVVIEDSLHFGVQLATSFQSSDFVLRGEAPFQAHMGPLHLNNVGITLANNDLANAGFDMVLDTLSMTMPGADQIDLQLHQLTLSLPQASTQGGIKADYASTVAGLWLRMKQEGQLLNNLPLQMTGRFEANPELTNIYLKDAVFKAAQEELKLYAEVNRPDTLTTHMASNLSLAPTSFSRLLALVPRSMKKDLKGMDINGNLNGVDASVDITLVGDAPAVVNNFEVKTGIRNFKYQEGRAMGATLKSLDIAAQYPVKNAQMDATKRQLQVNRQKATKSSRRSKNALASKFMLASISGQQLHVEMHDSMEVVADLPAVNVNANISDEILQDPNSVPFIAADFSLDQLSALADTIALRTHQLSGAVTLADGVKGMKTYYEAKFRTQDADIQMGKEMSVVSGPLQIEASSVFDDKKEDLLLRYNPQLKVNFKQGNIKMAAAPYPFLVPSIDFDFNLGHFVIRDSQLRYGNSDFSLKGEVNDLREYLNHEADLHANLQLNSSQTDVYQLMDLVELLAGPVDSTQVAPAAVPEAPVAPAADPFMVPEHIDLTLLTNIQKTLVGENVFNNLGGKLSVKDAQLVLEEMGFSSKAARMQLTALYRSPKKDNLFVGANFHLLDIEIAELLKLVPEIDTIVPMLRSFEGKAEFHLAAETNLFANYDPKMSTLKATAAIEGKDLVLLDGETFSTISKYLMFNKKTRNAIDTLSVELAVNRRKMTLYPMLIGMDKYQAVISGNHDLTGNMPFNYHISVTDCPVVGGHIGLDLEGDIEKPEDISFKVVGCKYANLYKPEKRNITQAQTMELKTLISQALKRTVKEQPAQ